MSSIWLIVSKNERSVMRQFNTDLHGRILVQEVLKIAGISLDPQDKIWIKRKDALDYREKPYRLDATLHQSHHDHAYILVARTIPARSPTTVSPSLFPELLPFPLSDPFPDPIIPPQSPQVAMPIKTRKRRAIPRETERRKVALRLLRKKRLQRNKKPDNC